MHKTVLSENFWATDRFETPIISGSGGGIALRKIFEKQVVKILSGLNWLRIRCSDGPL
jgi:hypothetical protein